jgi:VIT1/CCC1 family predicted Fe2+/Mn2+ transporter
MQSFSNGNPGETNATSGNDNIGNNAQISVFANYADLPSIIGEPLRSNSSNTFQLTSTSGASTTNSGNVVYGAYYDPSNTADSRTNGLAVYSGTQTITGSTAPSAAFYGFQDVGADFTTSTFSMGVFYGVTPTSTSITTRNTFAFSGTTFLEQTPEPSHTALPVGIAAGLLVLRRRRVMR